MKPYFQHTGAVDLAAVRERLAQTHGQTYWRSLEEVGQTKEFQEFLHREFPAHASEWTDDLSRRNFLKLMGASLALAGATGCTRQPISQIVPYVKQPEEIVPGQPLFFATAMSHDGFGTGLLVESHEGHPTKIEGNPEHPSSLGATSVWDQASILGLYDPDRSQAILNGGKISTWSAFRSVMLNQSQSLTNGAAFRILTETVTSPTLAAQIEDLLRTFPGAKWHQWQPVSRDHVREGARLAFGEIVETQPHFDKARVIVALDSDFLLTHPQRLRYTRDFASGRRLATDASEMNRLYVAESTPGVTGSMADHRLAIRSSEMEAATRTLLHYVQSEEPGVEANAQARWLRAAAQDLKKNRGASIVIAGDRQSPRVHALVHKLNSVLGNVGSTLTYTASAEATPLNQLESLRELCSDAAAGKVELLLILGGNPVFTAPADLPFASALSKIKTSVHLSLEDDETSAYCHWHIPEAHFLEAWSDVRAFDGTVSIVQPLIAPLYDGKSAHEVLTVFDRQQQELPQGYEIVRAHWRQRGIGENFERAWRKAVHDGVLEQINLPLKNSTVIFSAEEPFPKIPSASADLELTFHPDSSIWDGRFANNGWLQELAKPVTKLTWDNAALISPALAQARQLANGDVVELRFKGRSLRVPVWITPGQAEHSVALHLGQGRTRTGRVGTGTGFNAYALRTSDALWFGNGLEMTKTGERHALATTQVQHVVEGQDNLESRDILFSGTLAQFKSNPDFVGKKIQHEDVEASKSGDTLYDPKDHAYDGYRWGMTVDLTTCIGCNACILGCQSENNIPVVGKEQVMLGRDMLWLRVDSYFRGSLDNPEVHHMPVPCMHCENAPCELVCPVGATVHDHEGLNVMVYNRCVGTRYCSNNCPYKVRRFNFLQYADYKTPSLKPMRNPNVTVRWRGVMEKCTYCVQRISSARITAKEQNRRVRDGEVVPACAQACPAQAITFGDLSDPNSAVSRSKKHPLNYEMLGTLNTKPRTTYLAKIRNPNPELEGAADA